jgi:hypothetical protein
MVTSCSRCGRAQRHKELTWQGSVLGLMRDEADIDGRVLFEGQAWGRIADQDICPECISAEEEQELARSYVDLVEQEVTRLQAAGDEPSAHEAALIAYALVLRSRLADADQRTLPPPRG